MRDFYFWSLLIYVSVSLDTPANKISCTWLIEKDDENDENNADLPSGDMRVIK